MYSGEEFRKIVEPFSSHSHNSTHISPCLALKIVDFPEIPDGRPVHHVVCGICGEDLTFNKGASKHNLGGNPMPESKYMPA